MVIDNDVRSSAKNILENKSYDTDNFPSKLTKLFKNKLVTVITSAYNVGNYIEKTIESVINQTIGIRNIQFIIVDDASTDDSKEIIKKYAKKYKDITGIYLHNNTGSPGTPRNLGIELALGEYIMFLDGDDWLHPEGIEKLYKILEETQDDYVVGKTIKVQNKAESIIGEYASVKERRNISPFEVPHFFHHMGPTARMMKTEIIKQYNLGFPDMKFAEDKYFFFSYLTKAKSVSTTTAPIYYANRLDENTNSLTRITNVLDKRGSDLKIIEYVKQLDISIEKKKVLLNRVFEYDFIRTFDSQTFIKAENKDDFFASLEKAFNKAKDLPYEFTDVFYKPVYKVLAELFLEDKKDQFIELVKWYKNDGNKQYIVKEGIAYAYAYFLEEGRQLIELPLFSRYKESYYKDKKFHLSFEVYGREVSNIESVIFRDRKRIDNDLIIKPRIENNSGEITLELETIDHLLPSLYATFIRYNEYELINIKQIAKNKIVFNKKQIDFYATLANNVGLSIKKI